MGWLLEYIALEWSLRLRITVAQDWRGLDWVGLHLRR